MADARARAFETIERRSAGRQAIIARNELIRRELARGTPAAELARRYELGPTSVEKLGTQYHDGKSADVNTLNIADKSGGIGA